MLDFVKTSASVIAVELTVFEGRHGVTGIGRYTRNIVRSLATLQTAMGSRLVVVTGRHGEATQSFVQSLNGLVDIVVAPALAPVSREEMGIDPASGSNPPTKLESELEAELASRGVSAYFDPDPLGFHKYFFRPARIKQVVTIHDLFAIKYRKNYFDMWSLSIQKEYLNRLQYIAGHSAAILFPSQATAKDYFHILPPRPDLVHSVTREGVDPAFLIEPSPMPSPLRQPFTLIVSNGCDPRKNLCFTLRAFGTFLELARDTPYAGLNCVVVSAPEDRIDLLQNYCQEIGIAERVAFHVGISDIALSQLYRQAALLICSSGAEGFGLPVIEALACRTPVVRNNAAALAELRCDGWIMDADLSSEHALAASILRALTAPRGNPETVKRYVANFNWDRVARSAYGVLAKITENTPAR